MAKTRRNYHGKGKRHGKSRSKRHSSNSVIDASVKGIKTIMKPRLKSDFEKMDKSVISKSVVGLQKKTRGLFSMFGLNKAFTSKNRPGKRVSFYII
jgi:hypothetical protein